MASHAHIAALYPSSGGMLAPATLRALAESAATHGNGTLRLSARQEIVVPGLRVDGFAALKNRLPGRLLWPLRPDLPPNIVTTAPAQGGRAWVREGVYAGILASFQSRPGMSVCIADPEQRLLPASLGRINFHASATEDLWHLQVALENGAFAVLDGALRSADLAAAVRRVEARVSPGHAALGLDALPAIQRDLAEWLTPVPYAAAPPLLRYAPLHAEDAPPFSVPALGGQLHSDSLQAICVWAMHHGLPRFALTPWKTLLIPALSPVQRDELLGILVRHQVRMDQGPWRTHWLEHGAGEHGEALRRALTQSCPIATGISVAVVGATDPAPDTQIVVRVLPHAGGRFRRSTPRFTVYQRAGLDARAAELQTVAESVDTQSLPGLVLGILEQRAPKPILAPAPDTVNTRPQREKDAWRCTACLTEYCAALGDPLGGIAPGTDFGVLPETWACPTCGEARGGFSKVSGA